MFPHSTRSGFWHFAPFQNNLHGLVAWPAQDDQPKMIKKKWEKKNGFLKNARI
jgi:hypothetical protein